jgi:diacylglycerol kinase family enzyme
MHYFIIYNPRSGKKKRKDIEDTITSFFLKRNLKCTLFRIGELQLEKLIGFFKSAGNSRVVVVGGDGTLRSIYSFFHFNKLDLPIAFVPLGSANISARSLGAPLRVDKALERAINGKVKSIDCGLINEKHLFSISACFGKVAQVTVETKDSDKSKMGARAYFKKSHVFLAGYKKHPFELKHQGKNQNFNTAHSVMVCNHFNVLGLNLKKRKIDPDDGQLDVLIATNPSFWGSIRAAIDLFVRKGQTKNLRQIKISDAVLSGQDFDGMVHCDGEKIELASKNITVKTIPNCIKVVI